MSSDNLNVSPESHADSLERNLNALWVSRCTRVGNPNTAKQREWKVKKKRKEEGDRGLGAEDIR